MTIKEIMSRDHKNCDLLFAEAENAVANNDWVLAKSAFTGFLQAMERHLGLEEQLLFPAFEEATGMRTGPTAVMRTEHEQMRTLFSEMLEALERKESDDFHGLAETLLILIQQHNIKEEQILYNMLDQMLPEISGQWQQQFATWQNNDVS